MTYNTPPNVPAQPGYGARPAIPPQVNTAAILLFVSGAFGILGGLLFLTLGSIGGLFVAIGVFLLIISAVEIWVGVALRQLKAWARTAAMALAAIGGLFSLISLVKGSYTSIVSLGLDIFIIYLLMQPPSVQALANSRR